MSNTPFGKRVHVIGCGVLGLDMRAAAQRHGMQADMEFLPGGLHEHPLELRARLQETIDRVSAEAACDIIAVAYGVCGLGTAGIHARQLPLIIPRVHDCIALFLGSDQAYREQFARHPGTYYISAGWVKEKGHPQAAPTDEQDRRVDAALAELVAKYGEENSRAIRHFLSSWKRNYSRAVFIDTGVDGRRDRYAKVAEDMARELGWTYEELQGTGELLRKLLSQQHSDAEVLVVPPHHVTVYDGITKGLKAVPVWKQHDEERATRHTVTIEGAPPAPGSRAADLGLGIDAGGTYTDAVVFDFRSNRTLAKAKALTTKWDFTIGIDEALDGLDPDLLRRVDLVSLSTTLATNAIVEGRGQTVGLLVMPPTGVFDPDDFAHRPIAAVRGKLSIDGEELEPVDADEIRAAAQAMLDQHVEAFAVTGYASHKNPSHEQQARDIIRAMCDKPVTCGHEVSETLNYRVRAQTAALNSRIIPCLCDLLERMAGCLAARGIRGPAMVVKSDGSLMSLAAARARPIETILSGPAASVAGARHLADRADAMVVDIGGTTTDTARIVHGTVQTCREGASVGGWRTHVQALDMRTLGLGGDSLIALERGGIVIGPRRVGPIGWLAAHRPGIETVLDWIHDNLDRFDLSTRGMDILCLNEHGAPGPLSDIEQRMIAALAAGPLCIQQLAGRVHDLGWRMLPVERLEERHVIQRCGLTPTDVLHALGRISLWEAAPAARLCDAFSRLLSLDRPAFAEKTLEQFTVNLAAELVKKELGDEIDPDALSAAPSAMALLHKALRPTPHGTQLRITLGCPVIGIGAPVGCFLPAAATLLNTTAIIPPDADVANAIGAITSSVSVHKRITISVDETGRYTLEGLPDAPRFLDFHEAHLHAVERLTGILRAEALRAGTSETSMQIVVDDHVAPAADGSSLFLGRTLEARLSGRPDIARLGC